MVHDFMVEADEERCDLVLKEKRYIGALPYPCAFLRSGKNNKKASCENVVPHGCHSMDGGHFS